MPRAFAPTRARDQHPIFNGYFPECPSQNPPRSFKIDSQSSNVFMKKLLILSKLFVSSMSMINLTSLRLDTFIQLWDISSVIIGLELVFF